MATLYEQLQSAVEMLKNRTQAQPRVALILGSSQGAFAERVEEAVTIPYGEIPGMPVSAVAGHAGELKIGKVGGVEAMVFCGRVHFYEGWTMQQVTFNVRLAGMFGVETMVITNAAGGVNAEFEVGDFMLIADHINMMGDNPLMGDNVDAWGPRFPDMSKVYDPALRERARVYADEYGITLREGVYSAGTGPAYETPAEVRMARMLGADAVGMSTVPEAIAARHMGLKVLGLSTITNMAAGMTDQPLSHEEVQEASEKVKDQLLAFLAGLVEIAGK